MAYDNLDLVKAQQPSHIESGYADEFILNSKLLQDVPNLLPTYFQRAGYQQTTLSKMSVFGFGVNKKESSSPFTGHYEKPQEISTITVGDIISVTGNSAVIALTADDMVSETTPTGTILFSRPRVTETLQFSAGGTLYRITSKNYNTNPHQLTLKAAVADADPNDDIIEGNKATIMFPIKGEATDQIEPLRQRQIRYQNTFGILDETHLVSGTNLTTKVAFTPVPGKPNLLWIEGIEDEDVRHQVAKGNFWMFSKKTDPNNWVDYSNSLKQNVNIPGSEGLLEFIMESGLDVQYDPNDFDIDDIYAIASYYQGIRTFTSRFLMLQGYGINQRIEKAFGDKWTYNWVAGLSDEYLKKVPTMKNGNLEDAQGLMVNMGVKGFVLGNYTWMSTGAPEFSDAYGPGAIGYNDWMVIAPFGWARDTNDARIPYMGYEYRGANGYAREDEMWASSGAGNRRITGMSDFMKTIENDSHSVYLRSEIAPHFSLGDQFTIFRPSNGASS